MITKRATLGIGFYHRIFGDIRSPRSAIGHGTIAHATYSRNSAVEMDLATQSSGDGAKSGDQCGSGRLGGDPGEGDRADLGGCAATIEFAAWRRLDLPLEGRPAGCDSL